MTLSSLLGLDIAFYYMRPFGYIGPVNLSGVGICNNPFYNDNFCTNNVPLVGMDDLFPGRTGFGNHAFVLYDWHIFDACSGPAQGEMRIVDYLMTVIDTSTPEEAACAGISSDACKFSVSLGDVY